MSVGRKDLLVVEPLAGTDSEVIDLLHESGYGVTNVSSEADCLSEIESAPHGLVLISLPNTEFDTVPLVSEILKIDEDLPIVLISVNGDEEKLVNLLEAGATDFLRFTSGQGVLLQYVIEKNLQHHSQLVEQRATEEKLENLNKQLDENLKILERDQQAGFRLQVGMMPASPKTIGKVRFEHQIYPSLILSGDFIDYFALPDGRVMFYMADVSGHGASSAFVTVLLKSLSRRLENDFTTLGLESAADVLIWLNRELLRCDLEQHVTMFLGIIDSEVHTLDYSNAAQFPAAILHSDNETKLLEIGGLPLGLYQSPEYDARAISLSSDYAIVMFSDGVFEIMSEQTLKAKEDHLLSVVKCGNTSVESLAGNLGLTTSRNIPDDIAIFMVAGVG